MRDVFRELGRADALRLREEAHALTGTQIIRREVSVPTFEAQKDYTGWPVGAPVTDEGQVWLLLQPHNAADYGGRPSSLRALWGLAHTTDADRARPWVDPYGTSGMYMQGECYRDEGGTVWRCRQDETIHSAAAWPEGWSRERSEQRRGMTSERSE